MSYTANPWKIIADKEIYTNPWITVTEYNVINPTGGKGIYGKVHFKNMAIGIIPYDNDGNIWLVGQYRFTLNEYSWEIPEGGGALDIHPLKSAKRELVEETGLSAGRWDEILRIHLSNSVTDEYGVIFLARELLQGISTPEETEKLMVKKLPFNEVYEMVKKGEITDVMSVAAIQQVKLMQLEGRL